MEAGKSIVLRHKIIGAMLRKARTEAGKSLEETAHVLGSSSEQVARYEYGQEPISLPELEALAKFLGISVLRFLEEESFVEAKPPEAQHEAPSIQAVSALPSQMRKFIADPASFPYLEMALKAKEIPPQILQRVVEALLALKGL